MRISEIIIEICRYLAIQNLTDQRKWEKDPFNNFRFLFIQMKTEQNIIYGQLHKSVKVENRHR